MSTVKQVKYSIGYVIEQLLHYGINKKLLDYDDISYVRNQLLQLFHIAVPANVEIDSHTNIEIDDILNKLIEYGIELGLVDGNSTTYRDLLDAKIMGLLMPRPSQFIAQFEHISNKYGVRHATQYFYGLSIDSRYIRMDRVKQNPFWQYEAEFGQLQMTINLSKPEKDPAEIAKLKLLTQSSYPQCLLCKENEGYEGRLDHPARQNLRLLPISLQQEKWFLQYSPYVYYNEHSIVLNSNHHEMKITTKTFARLLDFVEQFPHYFIGSNADLPIVGGSILNHDHYQAGHHQFPMEKAKIVKQYHASEYPNVTLSIVDWPMSVIRLQSEDKEQLLEVADIVLEQWKEYSDEQLNIIAYSTSQTGERVRHNTITPIARLTDNHRFELDLVLRNNRTTLEHPYGIFHPHEHLHHIKKENIGLIEVMGLAVLPARLKTELQQICSILCSGDQELISAAEAEEHVLFAHREWIKLLWESYGWFSNEAEAMKILQKEVGKRFAEALYDGGVFKRNSEGKIGFDKFIKIINYK